MVLLKIEVALFIVSGMGSSHCDFLFLKVGLFWASNNEAADMIVPMPAMSEYLTIGTKVAYLDQTLLITKKVIILLFSPQSSFMGS